MKLLAFCIGVISSLLLIIAGLSVMIYPTYESIFLLLFGAGLFRLAMYIWDRSSRGKISF